MTIEETNVDASKAKQKLIAFLTRVSENAKKLEPQLHEAVMQIARHAEKYGDATPAQMFYNMLPKSQRREAMVIWFNTYTKIRIVKKGEKVGLSKAPDAIWNLEAGNADPFYNLDEKKVGRPVGEFDVLAMLTKKVEAYQEKLTELELCDNDIERAKIVKPGVNIQHEIDSILRDINILTQARAA